MGACGHGGSFHYRLYVLVIQANFFAQKGHVNLFTVRHDPGQFITALYGHRGPVSSLAVQHDEMGFFSAGWDGDVYVSPRFLPGILRHSSY